MKRLLFLMVVVVMCVSCTGNGGKVDRSKVMVMSVGEDSMSVDLLLESYGEDSVFAKVVCGGWDTVVNVKDGADLRCVMSDRKLKIYGAVEGLRFEEKGSDYDTKYVWDVSGNDVLQGLNVAYSNVAMLILGEQPCLEHLDCHDNFHMTELDVSGCPELKFLDCSINKLTGLDVSKCVKLEWLECSVNDLRYLVLSENRELKDLMCMGNEIEALDVSRCVKLERLICDNNNLKALDVSRNKVLSELVCSENGLKRLDVSGLGELYKLECADNELEELKVLGCSKLWRLLCMRNKLRELDVSGLTNLWHFGYEGNMIEDVDWVNEEAAKDVEFCS